MRSYINKLSRLLTEDPDTFNEGVINEWQHEVEMEDEELEDDELLGERYSWYVKFVVGTDWHEGSPAVMHSYHGGSPGEPDWFEWDIIQIVEAFPVDAETGEEVPGFELTDEWRKRIEEALNKKLDDRYMQDYLADSLEGADEPDADYEYENMRDMRGGMGYF